MQVMSHEIIVYRFTQEEVDFLLSIGIWGFIKNRLRDNEKIEVVNE